MVVKMLDKLKITKKTKYRTTYQKGNKIIDVDKERDEYIGQGKSRQKIKGKWFILSNKGQHKGFKTKAEAVNYVKRILK